jgi:Ca2+-binding RTX toxin-like protein
MEPDAGIDQVHGGTGRDVANYTWSPTGIAANLTTGLVTGWGDDTLSGIEDLWGSQGDDVLIGDAGGNEIWGTQEGARDDGDDTIEGRGGNDYLFGLEGADTMYGDAGDDLLNGDDTRNLPGPDALYGGAGEDRCFYGESYAGCESS